MGDIPLVDLAAQHEAVADEVAAGWRDVVAETAFIDGPKVTEFEREYAAFSHVAYCTAVANGTDAIELALRAAGIGPGDECIVPANTFIATAEAVVRTGATAVLVDCTDDGTYLIDHAAVAAAVTARTRAIIPVHLYGQLAPVERLLPLADAAGAVLVEDAAQCHGARRYGKDAGSLGYAAAISFYPGKNLGAYGDAGAVLTRSGDVAERIRMIRDHGSAGKHTHDLPGVNSRMDTLQAVVLSAKLRRLAAWNAARRAAASRYEVLLSDVDLVIRPRALDGNEHVWHLYVVQVPDRDRVLRELHAVGIGAAVHYPRPIHQTPAYAALARAGLARVAGPLTVAGRTAPGLLSLPLFPGITPDQQQRVVSALVDALG